MDWTVIGASPPTSPCRVEFFSFFGVESCATIRTTDGSGQQTVAGVTANSSQLAIIVDFSRARRPPLPATCSSWLLLHAGSVLLLLSSISLGNDQQAAVGALSQTFGCYPRIVLQRCMNDPPVGGAERIHRDGLSLPLGLLAQAQRHIFQRFAPPLAIVFDVDNQVRTFGAWRSPAMRVTRYCKRFQSLALAPDQQPAILGADLQDGFVASVSGIVSTVALTPINSRISASTVLAFADQPPLSTGSETAPAVSMAGALTCGGNAFEGESCVSAARMRAFCAPKPKMPFLPSDKTSTVILSRRRRAA